MKPNIVMPISNTHKTCINNNNNMFSIGEYRQSKSKIEGERNIIIIIVVKHECFCKICACASVIVVIVIIFFAALVAAVAAAEQ